MRLAILETTLRHRGLLAAMGVLAVVAGTLMHAHPVSADSVQVQSYQRASESQKCASQPGETPWQTSWGTDPTWKPSWEQWANGGLGGWTCTRSIVWARTTVTGGSPNMAYSLGDIGPGGGRIFLIEDGVRYEMAPNFWGSGVDRSLAICEDYGASVIGTSGTAIGTGAANTAALGTDISCDSSAAAAALAYAPAGTSAGQWYLPSQFELNAMCNFSRNPDSPAPPTVICTGTQDADFAAGDFGFVAGRYWSSSSMTGTGWSSWTENFLLPVGSPSTWYEDQDVSLYVRPIRAF